MPLRLARTVIRMNVPCMASMSPPCELHEQHYTSIYCMCRDCAEEMCVSVYTCADRSISYHSNHRTTERLMSQFHDQVLLADAFI